MKQSAIPAAPVASNRSAIGAKVWLTSGGLTQVRRVSGGDSAHSQQDLILNFGVSNALSIDIVIDWPSGLQESYPELPVNALHFIQEGVGVLAESLTLSLASWDRSDKTLLVSTATSYGGRARHTALGFGSMPYAVEGRGFREVFEGVANNPGTVTVVSDSGAAWSVPVKAVP